MQVGNNSNSGKIFDIVEDTDNTKVLKEEYEHYYKDKGVNFVKSYFLADGEREWRDPTTSRKVFFEIFQNIQHSESDVFMDCGCGLGHIVYLASNCFKKVIGVEVLKSVFEECCENLKKLITKNDANVILKNCDMLDLEDDLIDSVTVFYFACPFDDITKFRLWLEKILSSFSRNKRRIYFIYYYPIFENELNNSIFKLDKTLNSIGETNIYSVGNFDAQ